MKKVFSQLVTLLIVTAITLLVWLYAEDANIEEYTEQSVRVQFVVPTEVEGLVTPSEPITVLVDFDGSNGQFQQFDDARDQVIKVELPIDQAIDLQTIDIDIRDQLEGSPLFSDLGINLKSVSPERLPVTFEKVIDVQLNVKIQRNTGSIKLSDATFTAEQPPTVNLRMPASRALGLAEAQAIAQLTEEDVASLPKGTPQQITVPLIMPAEVNGLPRSISSVDLLVTVADDRDTVKIDRRPILLSYPSSINERYIVEVEEPARFITAFELEGPRDQIALIKEDPATKTVWASVRISNEEADEAAANGGVLTKTVNNIAPPGVVLASDVVRVKVKVTPREAPAAP